MARYKPVHRSQGSGRAPSPAAGTPNDAVPAHHGAAKPGWRRRPWLAASVVVAVLAATGVVVGATSHHSAEPKRTAPLASGDEKETVTTTAGKVVGGEIGPSGPTAPWVQAENAKPGTADWHLVDTAQNGEIEGYADRVSITPGQPANLYVSTSAPTYHVEAYRMGYYQGLGGRLIWKSSEVAGTRQARPTVSYPTNMVQARWQPSLAIPSDASWPVGDYLFKLVASTGQQQYVPLVVRNDQSTAAYVLMGAVTTWQAYNDWGGYDLYEGLSGRTTDFAHRSRVVSFDRPYRTGSGSGEFLTLEYPLVSLAESLGLDVDYVTNVDVHEHPELLQRHRAVISLGHDEYYSLAMRQGLIDARDHGVNLAFMGANAVYRHIRFAPSSTGPDREVICYKSAAEDPLYGHDNADLTVDWQDPPTSESESALIGDLYQCNPVTADLVVTDASNWLFAGTGLHDGDKLKGVVAWEYDRFDARSAHPPNVEVLSHSPLRCGGQSDHSDATYYSALSGAGVFATGTIGWIPKLDRNCGTRCPGPTLILITQNLLAAFGVGPAGQTHPSVTNTSTLGKDTGGTAPPLYIAPSPAVPARRVPVRGYPASSHHR